MSFRRIIVGISGGVDSAVSALLLKRKGYDVHGVFMKNWDEIDESGQCMGEKDWLDAQYVCQTIGIPILQVNFVKEYWNNVFWRFLEDYQSGLTPNPDILCNKHIKFDQFFKYATKNLNADAIATGHYARTSFGSFLEDYQPQADVKLLQAADNFKDQTFFLAGINQAALRRTMFPIGDLHKSEVKRIAKEANLHRISVKKESTGICFIGQRNFQSFISEYLDSKPGKFIDVDTGKVVGTHNGIHQWTLGQRCRISGCLKPYFIAHKDVESNAIVVAAGTNHPALFARNFKTHKPSWIRETSAKEGSTLRCQFRFQHTNHLVNCTVHMNRDGLQVDLDESLRSLTPGQYAVFYRNGECLGCARICEVEINFNCNQNVMEKEELENS